MRRLLEVTLTWLTLPVFLIISMGVQAEESRSELLAVDLLESINATELVELYCPTSMECAARCDGGEGQTSFSYTNVKRLAYSQAGTERLVALVYLDPLGKGHRATSFLPLSSSCVFDDLNIESVSPLVDGSIQRRQREDVIFELRPDD